MVTIADRLRLLREQWGTSARKLSLDLGLNESSWGVYEAGTSLPGAAVLAKLVARQVNINWLLTGEGEPLETGGNDVNSVLNRLEAKESQKLGISRLTLLASQAHIRLRMAILEVLARNAPRALQLSDIESEVSGTQAEVVLALIDLIRAGQVKADASESDQIERYSAVKEDMGTRAVGEADKASLTLESIRFMSHELAPALVDRPDTAILFLATARVPDAKLFIQDVRDFLRQHGAGHESADSETVKLVFAARIEK